MSEFILNDLKDIDSVAAEFLSETKGRKIFAFYGGMGAGKTTFIKALCRQLEALDTVTSPTFTLVNEYQTREGDLIYHFDFYRIEEVEEVFDFGIYEYLQSGRICFMEWPEKIEDLLPEETVKVIIEVNNDFSRTLSINNVSGQT